MSKNYYDVNRSQLNKSTAKQTYVFDKSSRFGRTFEPPCSEYAYNINRSFDNLKNFNPDFTKSRRFVDNKNQNPSSVAYKLKDFAELNKQYNKGIAIGKQSRMTYKRQDIPGPGSYVLNPEKNLSYTMRKKTKQIDLNSWNVIGPGHYFQDSMGLKYSDSRFKNVTMGAISKSSRFTKDTTFVPGPGKYYSEKVGEMGRLQTQPISKYTKTAKFIFGKEPKGKLTLEQKNQQNQPGPGSYEDFSQFASLNKSALSFKKYY